MPLECGPLTDVSCAAHSSSFREEREHSLMCSLSSALCSPLFLPSCSFTSHFLWVLFLQSERFKALLDSILVSLFFFPALNSYAKSPHHPTSHSSHLPAASISKFLSIPEFYINFRELWKTKYISINTSVASLMAFGQFFSSVSVLFIRGFICHRSGKTAQVLLDSFKQMMLQHFSDILTQLEIRWPVKHIFICQKHFAFHVNVWATCSPNHWKWGRHQCICFTKGWGIRAKWTLQLGHLESKEKKSKS